MKSSKSKSLRWLYSILVLALMLSVVTPPTATSAATRTAGSLAPSSSTIAGFVFQDHNGNGVKDNGTPPNTAIDPGVAGVTVTAYVNAGGVSQAVGSAVTNASGNYSIVTSDGGSGPYRVEFTVPAGYEPGPIGPDNGSSVQFVNGSNSNVNFGLLIPAEYTQNADQLDIATNMLVPAKNVTPGPNSEMYNLFAIPYNGSGNPGVPTQDEIAQVKEIGTTWGLAYQSVSKTVFAGAFMKRHTGFGPAGSGGIYSVQAGADGAFGTADDVVGTFIDLNAIGIPTGPDPHPNSNEQMLGTPFNWFHDANSFSVVGKMSLGDIEISDDEQTLYVINMLDRSLYQLPIGDPPTAPAPGNINSYLVPVTLPNSGPNALPAGSGSDQHQGCALTDVRPFGLGFNRGKLYVGLVCSAQSTQDQNDLRAYVYRFDPAVNAFETAPVAEFPLTYPRGCVAPFLCNNPPTASADWQPWTDTFADLDSGTGLATCGGVSGTRVLAYPQPSISHISFDRGQMIIGFRDRTGDQSGCAAGNLNPASFTTYSGFPSGDILRACFDSGTSRWLLESNGSCGGVAGGGVGDGKGPGGGQFYLDSNPAHDQPLYGGVLQVPGYPTVAYTLQDPFYPPEGNVFSGGLQWLENATGTGSRRYLIYPSSPANTTMGKAGALGDMESLPNPAPIEIGNYVWFDANFNGIQDADETPIAGVTVNLYSTSGLTAGTLIATAVTDAKGEYYFSSGSGASTASRRYGLGLFGPDGVANTSDDLNLAGLKPTSRGIVNTFALRIDNPANYATGQPLVGLGSTLQDADFLPGGDARDSDAGNITNPAGSPPGSWPVIGITAGTFGQSNHTYDFGLTNRGPGAIGNCVWVDENSDGYQDVGEPGIPNVQVNLYNVAGALIATTYTDSDCGYMFTNLPPGTYYVDVLDGTGNQPYTFPQPDMSQTTPSTLPGADFGNQDHSSTPIPNTSNTGYPVTIGGDRPHTNKTADFGYNYNPDDDVNTPTPAPTPAPAALGDRVWIDSNGNGAQDPNEIGVTGATVQLFTPGPDGIFGTPDDVAGATKQTDSNGYYMFDNLAPGTYVVKVVSDTGASHPILGSSYTQTGDPDHFGTTGSNNDNMTTVPVPLAPGDVFLNADFGYKPNPGTQLGSIGDTIWFDANANGTGPSIPPVDGGAPVTQGNAGNPADPSEFGIPGVSVSLVRDSNGNGIWDAGEPVIATDTTDSNGQYLFVDLPIADGAGTDDYLVWVNDANAALVGLKPTYDKDGGSTLAGPGAPTGAAASTLLGISAVANLSTTPVRDQDFGYAPLNHNPALGLIGDTVWLDLNNSGTANPDAGEPGIEGVVLELLVNGNVVRTTTTDRNGLYAFGGLPLNVTYQVRVAASNFAPGGVLEGLGNTYSAGAGVGTNIGNPVLLTSVNPVNLLQDFSYIAPPGAIGRVGNLLWLDQNANGHWDGTNGPDGLPGTDDDEGPIGNVTADLYRDLNGNGVVDPGEPRFSTTTTVASLTSTNGDQGNYLFNGLPVVGSGGGDAPAEWVVKVTDTNGVLYGYWHSLGIPNTTDESQTDPDAAEISVGTPNDLKSDFGYYVEPACLGNFVWEDFNGNGIQDAGEPGIDGVTVTLTLKYGDGTSYTIKTVTGDDPSTPAVEKGWYSFCNLLIDEDNASSKLGTPTNAQPVYTISVQPPPNRQSSPISVPGSNNMNDSNDPAGVDGLATQGLTNVVQNANPNSEGNPQAGYDFGFFTPLAVTLADFSAAQDAQGVTVRWETISEVDHAGFNVYRSESLNSIGKLLAFVPAQAPGNGLGASYVWSDASAAAGGTYYYWLDAVDVNGATERFGPASILPGPGGSTWRTYLPVFRR